MPTVGPRALTGSLTGHVIGGFELREEIGRGGMGTVYKAHQRSLDRIVAVKVLGSHVSESARAITRFKREAQAAAKLHHPHIVPIFGQGEENGVYYYAMEYVDGKTIHELINDLRASAGMSASDSNLDDTVALDRTPQESGGHSSAAVAPPEPKRRSKPAGRARGMSDVARLSRARRDSPEYFSLVAHHLASVADALDYAHRQGVIHRDIKPHNLILGSDDSIRISDFGLARIMEHPGVTITGELIGSPLYMSREQIVGGPSEVDHRTDIYSLGVSLYEWLTLEPPFPGQTRERVISLIVNSDPVPIRRHVPNVPVDLETICSKAMEKNPDRRYQAAEQIRDDLLRFLESRPIQARRASPITRLRKTVERHKAASLILAAAFVAVAMGGALYRSRGEIKSQTQAAETAQTSEQETRQVIDDVVDQIGPGGMSQLPPEWRALVKGGAVVVDELAQLRGEGWTGKGALAAAAATPRGIASRTGWDFLQTLVPLGGVLEDAEKLDPASLLLRQALTDGDYEQARSLVQECLVVRPDDFDARLLHAGLACKTGRFAELATDVGELFRLRSDDPNLLLLRGLSRLLEQDTEGSLSDFTKFRDQQPLSTWGHAMRGLALVQARRMAEGVLEFNSALSLVPDLPVALLGRAVAYVAQKNLQEAVADLTRVLDMEPDNADALAARGEYYSAMGRYGDAAADFEAAMNIGGRTLAMQLQYMVNYSKHERTKRGELSTSDVPEPGRETQEIDSTQGTSRLNPDGWQERVALERFNR